MAGKDLPPDLLRILRNAEAEAKRLCNPNVTPLHLAEALRRKDDPQIFSPELGAKLDDALAQLPIAYSSPVQDPATLTLLQSVAADSDPRAALVESLSHLLTEVPAPQPTAAVEQSPSQSPALPPRVARFVQVADTTAPIVARRAEVNRLIAMLGARAPQPVLLLSDEGSGGSTMARCLAAVLADPGYSGPLAGRQVLVTNTPETLNASAADVLALGSLPDEYVVFLDDLEVLLRLGSHATDLGLLSAIRALVGLDRPVILSLEASYLDRFRAADRELYEELEPWTLPGLDDAEVLLVAESAAREISEYHHVQIPEPVLALAASPPRQVDTMRHPALAVSRLDRAAAAAQLREDRTAQAEDLGTAVSSQQYLAFDSEGAFARLTDKVIGQDEGVRLVVDRLSVTRASLDLNPERPDGVFLFAGPTGTGKTALALALAQEIYGSTEALIRLDMSEFVDEFTVSKLYGSPPGYVGSTEPESWLTTRIRKRPQSLLLLDEIEKAHPLVWNAFLQVFDAGRMTDTQGRVAEFSDVVIVLTTNIGAQEFAQRNDTGFSSQTVSVHAQESGVREELKRRMSPELLNRLDGVVVFHPLTPDTVRAIARERLADVLVRLQDRGWLIELDPSVEDLVVERGYQPEYGARPMIRTIEKVVLRPIAGLPAGSYRLSVVDGQTVVV